MRAGVQDHGRLPIETSVLAFLSHGDDPAVFGASIVVEAELLAFPGDDFPHVICNHSPGQKKWPNFNRLSKSARLALLISHSPKSTCDNRLAIAFAMMLRCWVMLKNLAASALA